MKVIKRASEEFQWTFMCTQCDSQCEADATDLIKREAGGDQRDSWPESFTVNCGVCNASNYVPTEDIPVLVRLNNKLRKSQ